jgi:hypothetical protein
MYARVARWEGADAEAMKKNAEEIKSRAASGPPEGVPSVGITFLVDPNGGRMLVVGLFETEDDLRKGDETLRSMSPPNDMGASPSVETYEVVTDLRP